MSEIKKLMEEYYEMFEETFPIKHVNLSEEDIIKQIKKCIEEETPYSLIDALIAEYIEEYGKPTSVADNEKMRKWIESIDI